MNYQVEEFEDQLLETLKADSALAGVNIETHAGGVTGIYFEDPALKEGLISRLPFVFVQYQGKECIDYDDSGDNNTHKITFRLFVGAQSLRATKESQRSAYALLRAIYDRIENRYFDYEGMYAQRKLEDVTQIQRMIGQQQPIRETPGRNEQLMVNLPRIVVYCADYNFSVIA